MGKIKDHMWDNCTLSPAVAKTCEFLGVESASLKQVAFEAWSADSGESKHLDIVFPIAGAIAAKFRLDIDHESIAAVVNHTEIRAYDPVIYHDAAIGSYRTGLILSIRDHANASAVVLGVEQELNSGSVHRYVSADYAPAMAKPF